MNLVVFDLDGTLTDTNAVDDECFVQALRIAFNIGDANTNWTEYSHVTDLGVALAAFKQKYVRDPQSAEISSFFECFASLLNECYSANADSFGEIAGASVLLTRLQQHSNWRAAIATGGWERCAKFKMAAAGIEADGIPAAFGEDGPARETIVETAIARACAAYGTKRFEQAVLVGDAVWDVRTAQRLGLPFVGVGSRERAALLRNAGANAVVENFLNYDRCMMYFKHAEVPKIQ